MSVSAISENVKKIAPNIPIITLNKASQRRRNLLEYSNGIFFFKQYKKHTTFMGQMNTSQKPKHKVVQESGKLGSAVGPGVEFVVFG
jgi:hypothetical protein